jgi:hypothetical protein
VTWHNFFVVWKCGSSDNRKTTEGWCSQEGLLPRMGLCCIGKRMTKGHSGWNKVPKNRHYVLKNVFLYFLRALLLEQCLASVLRPRFLPRSHSLPKVLVSWLHEIRLLSYTSQLNRSLFNTKGT